MSVNSVSQQINRLTTVYQHLSNSDKTKEFWQLRMTQNGCCVLTSTEAARLFFRVLGLGATGAGIAAVGAAVMGTVAWPIGLLAFPCALGAAGALWYSFQLDDYENPEELENFRTEASRMSLDQVTQAHGWNNLFHWGILTPEQFSDKFRHQMRRKNLVEIIHSYENAERRLAQCSYPRFDFQIPTPSEFRGQWRTETATKTFEEIIQTYPLDKLERYNLLEVGELHRIKDLKRDYDGIKGNYDTQVSQIEREFENNTQIYQRAYQADCVHADHLYNDNWAVQRLKVFELDYIRERQNVQETANRRKSEARERFERLVATITNHGQIPYDRLPPREKLIYDQQNHELQISIAQAENEARIRINNIDSRCISERSRLNTEVHRVTEERRRMIDESKGRYDSAVLPHRQYKEQRLAPVTQTFRSAVSDITGRYRAYLRTIGVAH